MCKPFVEDGVHPQVVVRAFRKATQMVSCLFLPPSLLLIIIIIIIIVPIILSTTQVISRINEIAVKISTEDEVEKRQLLERCAATALSSKLVAHQKDFFSKMVVDAVMCLDDLLPLNMIGKKKIQGGALEVCPTPPSPVSLLVPPLSLSLPS